VGVELRLQAIPDDCELLIKARINREVAEQMEFFNSWALGIHRTGWKPETPLEIYFFKAVQELVRQRPGLIQRYFYDGPRGWEAIIYLLSPESRAGNSKRDNSLVNRAIKGSEPLHPEAYATQGRPIGFVPVQDVRAIADFFHTVTSEQLHEHYKPNVMSEMHVYKMWPDSDETRFQDIWEEFVEIKNLYREAAAHNEAVITVID
jgi:hypothetical protein